MLEELKTAFAALGVAPDVLAQDDPAAVPMDVLPLLPEAQHARPLADFGDLQVTCCVALAISLLLRLKFYLKATYLLGNEKCQTYQPTKVAERPFCQPKKTRLP